MDAASRSATDAAPGSWVRDTAAGCVLRVHVRPGAARSEIAGLHGGALAVRVAARPVEGAANRALLATLAMALDVRPGALAVTAGTRGREKQVRVAGLTADTVRKRLGGNVDKGGAGA